MGSFLMLNSTVNTSSVDLVLFEKGKQINLFLHSLIIQAKAERTQSHQLAEVLNNSPKTVLSFINSSDAQKISNFHNENSKIFYPIEILDKENIDKRIDIHYWNRFYQESNLAGFLDTDSRDKWLISARDQDLDLPEFSFKNVKFYVEEFLKDANNILIRRTINVFKNLSDEHKTNSKFGFKSRLIFNNCSRYYGENSNKNIYLHELRCLISLLKGDDDLPTTNNTQSLLYKMFNNTGDWITVDNGTFRVKAFKKQTVHIEIEQSIADKLNVILANEFPLSLPDETKKHEINFKSSLTPRNLMLSNGVRNIISSISCDHPLVFKDSERPERGSYHDESIFQISLNLSGKHKGYISEAVSLIEELFGEKSNKLSKNHTFVWVTNHDPKPLLEHLWLIGEIPENSSHQFYESTDNIRTKLSNIIESLGGVQRSDLCLEPSAGRGQLATLMRAGTLDCVEINRLNCRILEQRGYHVIQDDFIHYSSQSSYDWIVMNPPFQRNSYVQHLLAAMKMLNAGGILLAVVPASIKKSIFEKHKGEYDFEELEHFTEQFEGTGKLSIKIIKIVRSNIL